MYHEHVVDGVQDDQDDLGVLGGQQVDDSLQGSTLHQGHHLLHSASAGEVVHYPHSFSLSLEVSLSAPGQNMFRVPVEPCLNQVPIAGPLALSHVTVVVLRP